MTAAPQSVAFIHLDMGIGGAESLILSAALALQSKNHKVSILTSHCDLTHCFLPIKNGQVNVEVFGDTFLPRQIFGRFTILFAFIRMVYICIRLYLSRRRFDVVFVDQVSGIILLVKLFIANKKTIFYCHYPDSLLCVERGGFLKRLYRRLFDSLEFLTLSLADTLLVNSEFTARVLRQFCPQAGPVTVLYPPTTDVVSMLGTTSLGKRNPEIINEVLKNTPFFLSLNRYERKKNIELALKAFKIFSDEKTENGSPTIHLLIAGGYDESVPENREFFIELQNLSRSLGISSSVVFLQSVSDSLRSHLLCKCIAVLYTPSNEHFGIVPVEAMAMGTPVIACNSGGPMESILHAQTGYLSRDNDPEDFAKHMRVVYSMSPTQRKKMSKEAKKRVSDKFSISSFACQLDKIVRKDHQE